MDQIINNSMLVILFMIFPLIIYFYLRFVVFIVDFAEDIIHQIKTYKSPEQLEKERKIREKQYKEEEIFRKELDKRIFNHSKPLLLKIWKE